MKVESARILENPGEKVEQLKRKVELLGSKVERFPGKVEQFRLKVERAPRKVERSHTILKSIPKLKSPTSKVDPAAINVERLHTKEELLHHSLSLDPLQIPFPKN